MLFKTRNYLPSSFTLLAFFVLVFSLNTQAQVAGNYSFSRTVVGYSAITGTTLNTPIVDDAIYTAIPLGFSFTFNCVSYTTVGISSNGFIWFGTNNPATNNYTPLSSGVMDGVISVYGSNIQSQGAGSYVRYTTTGVSPNRVFIVEWNRAKTIGGSRMDLQIKLFETTNAIQTMVNDASYFISTTVYGQVGIRGSTTTDYLNRSVTLAAGQSWATSIAGAANTATCVIDGAVIGIYPAAGTIYNWTFTGSCCTTPATQASADFVSGITLTTANLNWSTGSGSGGDIVFLKQGSAITTDPSNTTTYSANSSFASGTQIGATGAYAIYNGPGGATSISNLLPGTTYYYSIYTFDAIGPCYKTPTVTTGSFTTLSCSFPTTQATALSTTCIDYNSMNLRCTRGNGDRVIVLARAGSDVNADPVYNTTYTANSIFGSGSQIGTGNFVVYDGSSLGTLTIPITGLASGVTYYFKVFEYNTPPNCYNTTSPPTASGTTRAPGVYSSSTTTQNTANVAQGTLAANVVKLTVVISGGEDMAAVINSITFTSSGTTNTATDVTNVKIFYTGTSDVFSNATQYGGTFTTFGTNTAVDNFALKAGNNYFWIAYDVKSTATPGNVLDATVPSINITDNFGTANHTPTVTAPAGSRLITAPVTLVYCSGVIPEACCSGTGCNFSCCQGETLLSIGLSGSTILSFAGWPCNSTSGNDKNSYTDLFNSNIYSLNQGASSTMSINFDTWFSMEMWWVLWVDWNQDGVFTNSAPERYPSTNSISQWSSQPITVPASVSLGNHRARLWIQEFSYKPTDPCRITHGPLTTSLGYIVDFDIYVPDGSLPDLDPPPGPGASSCPTVVPIISTPINYTLGDVASQLTAIGTSLTWYTSPTGGVGSAIAPTPTTTSTGTQTYYVFQNNGTCDGARTQIAVNVYPPPMPLAPIATVTQPTCLVADGSILLSELPSPETWTINPNGINGSGTTYTIAPVGPGTYNYTVTNAIGCISPSSANAVVNPQPTTPTTPVILSITQPTWSVPTGTVVLTGLPVDGWTINPGGIIGAVGETSVTISGLAPGIYTFTVTNSQGCSSSVIVIISEPLPIELLYFTGECVNGYSILKWSTASETNNDYFTIEREKDAATWEVVAIVDGAGNSSSVLNYSFTAEHRYDDISYYRLKQTDFDGSFKYATPIFIGNCELDNTELIISPNPSMGIFNIQYNGNINQFRSIDIFTVLGLKIYHSDAFQSTIDLSSQSSGVYILHFNVTSKVIIEKIELSK
jgi:hypothetical protein